MSIINVDSISDAAGTGSPSFPNGMSLNSLTATGDVTAKNFIGSESNPAITSADADGYLGISGDSTVLTGGNIRLFSAAHATNANNILFRNNTTTALKYDSSATKWNFQANDVTTTGTMTATSYAGDGSALTGVGSSTAYAVGSHALVANYGAVVHNIGDTVAGSSLFTWELYSSADQSGGTTSYSTAANADGTAATSFTGTWRWLSSGPITSNRTRMGLAVRIS